MRVNGAIEGAAAGFSIGDEVIVLKKYDDSVIKVIGHTDGLRACGFRFKLTRGDGVILTDSETYGVFFTVKNSAGHNIEVAPVYSPTDQYWSFSIPVESVDGNGYWISYYCTDGIETQYPYRYKPADKRQVVDLIKSGSYIDTIPYWKIVTYQSHVPIGDQELIYLLVDETYTYRRTVYSSVPYDVSFEIREWNTEPRSGQYHHPQTTGHRTECINYAVIDYNFVVSDEADTIQINVQGGSQSVTMGTSIGSVNHTYLETQSFGPTVDGAVYEMTAEDAGASSWMMPCGAYGLYTPPWCPAETIITCPHVGCVLSAGIINLVPAVS